MAPLGKSRSARRAEARTSSACGRRAPSRSRCASATATCRWRRPVSACSVADVPASSGDDYAFVLDGGTPLPDRAARWQPEGLRGPSRVVDPRLAQPAPFDGSGARMTSSIYELHVGTFSRGGHVRRRDPVPRRTRLARDHRDRDHARRRVPGAPRLGLRRGLPLRRPVRPMADPMGCARLVDCRPRGRSGGHPRRRLQPRWRIRRRPALEAFGPYFTETYGTPWGRAINYDDADCDPVREWVLQSADRLGPRLRDRRAAPRCDPRDLRLESRAHRCRSRAAGPCRPRRCARDRGDPA